MNQIIRKVDLGKLEDYKIHCAIPIPSNGINPLNLFLSDNIEDNNDWLRWNHYRSNLNRKYIFTLIRMYKDSWLFSGIYEIVAKHVNYKYIRELDKFKYFTKKLKLNFKLYSKNVYLSL